MATKVREQIAVATPNTSHPNPLISHDKLRQLYSTMLTCRLLDEGVRQHSKQLHLDNDDHASAGREAATVGCAIDLRQEDTVVLLNRDRILSYAKGVSLESIFRQAQEHAAASKNTALTPDFQKDDAQNVVWPVATIEKQMKLSRDIALANQRKKTATIVVVFYSQGAAGLSAWHETLIFAGRRSLPMVFLQQNNLSEQFASVHLQNNVVEIGSKPVNFGFPEIAVDGNDAVAVYRVAQEAIERARAGGGPTLIDAQALPADGHLAMDPMKNQDPIAAMELYLTGKGLFSMEWKKSITETFQRRLEDAVEIAERHRHNASN